MHNKILTFLFIAFAFLGSIASTSCLAQGLMEEGIEKAYHTKKTSRVKFVLREEMPFQKSLPKPLRGQTLSVPGYLYSELLEKLPGESGTYDGLPLCTKKQLRTQYRPPGDTNLQSLDVIVYQHDDSRHRKKAKKFGAKAVPFIEGALSNPYRPQGDTEQSVLRVLGLQCLPTRVTSVRKSGASTFEYREGSLAWE